jgi:hypothetical protein
VASFRGIPSADGFLKRYELHYEPQKMAVGGTDVLAQFGCINFHAKCYGCQGARLTVTVKNKWTGGWTRAWFYCKVPLLRSPVPIQGKGVYALHSSMSALDFSTDPSFECADDDTGDLTFVHSTSLIGGQDIVEEYLTCILFPLSARMGFREITDGETPVSKVTLAFA